MKTKNTEKILNIEDYPTSILKKIEGETIEIENFYKNIEKVIEHAEKKGENLAINCIHIENVEKDLYFVASDSYRMKKSVEYGYNSKNINISIPYGAAKTILKIFDSKKKIDIVLNNEEIAFFQDEVYLKTRLIQLHFPAWKSVYNSVQTNNSIRIMTEDLEKALKELQVIAKNNPDAENKVLFEVKKDRIILSANNEKIKLEKVIKCISENEITIALSCKMLLDELKTITTKEIELKTYNATSAVIFNDNFLLMPLAL